MAVDLVMLAISGVQRFIVESKTTADVANSSLIIQRLAATAARAVGEQLVDETEPIGVIYPVVGGQNEDGVTSKVAFLAPVRLGPAVARAARLAVDAEWHAMVVERFGASPAVETPGMPETWWVSVSGSAEEYAELWKRATRLADARRRSRVFPRVTANGVWLCAQSSRLPSVDPPKNGLRRHEKRERLSAAGWVKRKYRSGTDRWATRSTSSIASTPFRVELLTDPPAGLVDQVGALQSVVSRVAGLVTESPVVVAPAEGLEPLASVLGAWLYPDVWNAASLRREYGAAVSEADVRDGRKAADGILRLADAAGVKCPSSYYAIIVQDVDKLGVAMGRLGPPAQRRASEQLVELGRAQRDAVVSGRYPGVAVYAGGDDLVALCPAPDAMALARRLRTLVDDHLGGGPLTTVDGLPMTASAAVVFAHVRSPLQTALAAAHEAVEDAKNTRSVSGTDRDAVAVVALRRGGERARSIQPWSNDGGDPVGLLDLLGPGSPGLSASLADQLERDEYELAQLAAAPELHAALGDELRRLVKRRGGEPAHAEALHALAWAERSNRDPDRGGGTVWYRPVAPLLVARFLGQEAGKAR